MTDTQAGHGLAEMPVKEEVDITTEESRIDKEHLKLVAVKDEPTDEPEGHNDAAEQVRAVTATAAADKEAHEGDTKVRECDIVCGATEERQRKDREVKPLKTSPVKEHCAKYKQQRIHSDRHRHKSSLPHKSVHNELYPQTESSANHPSERLALCSVCGKSVYKYYLPSHLRGHTGERPYSCVVCGKAFCNGSALDQHIRIHTGDKPYQCNICDMRFISSSKLTIHKKRHAGEKPFVCSVCGKAFAEKWNLTCHIRFHTGERPHKCSMCSKAFTASSALKVHMRSHTGEKPYICQVCRKCFRSSRQLQTHIRSHHTGERPFTCDECGRSFTEKRQLKSHMKVHFSESMMGHSVGVDEIIHVE